MDLNASPVSVSTSDSRPISLSPVMVTAGAAPATVEMKDRDSLEKKRERSRMYDSKGKSIEPSERPEESSRLRMRKGLGGGGDFKAHIFVVNPYEDIIERIMSFTENGSRSVCVLSANGEICNVKIQPLGFNRRVLTFKDAYEIISLSGTMAVTESGEVKNEIGGWRITIGGADGGVFAGRLFGTLTAASPVQVVVGSFWPMIQNPSLKRNNESRSLIVTPTTQNGLMGSRVTGQVQQPEMGTPSSHPVNRGLYGAGSGFNMNSRPNLNE